jgi:uncharacterized membrane protein
MSTYPNQDPNQSNQYGGYTGYTPPSQQNNPSGSQQSGYQGYQGYYQQQQGTDSQQSGYQTYNQGSQAGQQQQYSFYQPRYAGAGSGASEPTSTGLNARNAALLSYVLGWISGLVFFVIERKNRFVRFSAAQSIILFGGVTIIYVLLRLISAIPLIGFLLSPVLSCATFIVVVPAILLWLFLMFRSYQGVQVKLPVIGDYAERLVTRFSKKVIM